MYLQFPLTITTLSYIRVTYSNINYIIKPRVVGSKGSVEFYEV